MAIIQVGALIAGIRGRVGGVVFSRSRSGAYCRSLTKPTNSPTNRKEPYKSGMAQVFDLWKNSLTPAQRVVWNTLGTNTIFQNRLGIDYHPSGWNLFLRSNALKVANNQDVPVLDAPANAIATYFPTTFGQQAPGLQLTVTLDPAWGTDSWFFIWISSVKSPTVFFFRGPYVQMQPAGTTFLGSPIPLSAFGTFDAGDRIFIRTRFVNGDGAVTVAVLERFDFT